LPIASAGIRTRSGLETSVILPEVPIKQNAAWPAIRGLLRDRPFRAFLIANTTERFAASAMTVMVSFQIYQITQTPWSLGWLGLVEAVPGVTLILYGGHIADVHSRRKIALITGAMLTVLAGSLALASTTSSTILLPVIYIVAFLSACVRAFESPAATGLQAQILPLGELVRGVSLLNSIARLADVIGPVIGGFAWATLGPVGIFAIIAGLFALSTLVLAMGVPERGASYGAGSEGNAWQRIIEGIRYVMHNEILLGSMMLDLFAVFFGGVTALLPIFATDILHAGPTGFGLLRAASSAGSVVAALAAARHPPQRRAGLALHWAVGGFGLAVIIFGFSRNLSLSLAMLFLAGLCDGLSVVVRQSIMRLVSPERLRGRISAVRSVFVGSANELGAFESGMAAGLLGTTWAVVGGGLITLAVVGVTASRAPRLRRLNLRHLAPQ
jgi:MFS family permease